MKCDVMRIKIKITQYKLMFYRGCHYAGLTMFRKSYRDVVNLKKRTMHLKASLIWSSRIIINFHSSLTVQ